ncbi:hypothetical protein MMC20_001763 [Loxospora ochrophaea]|nr:hypothetical protein [Loxospora ochrophaea]
MDLTRHSRPYAPEYMLDKRDWIVTKIITGCENGLVFRSSGCYWRESVTWQQGSAIGRQPWWRLCRQPGSTGRIGLSLQIGSCEPDEVCLNFTGNVFDERAVCATLEDPIIITQISGQSDPLTPLYLDWSETSSEASADTAESTNDRSAALLLMMTDLSGPMNASTLQIAAQKRNQNRFGTRAWTTLPNGLYRCSNCDSIALDPVPQGTDRLEARVGLPGTASSARVFVEPFKTEL